MKLKTKNGIPVVVDEIANVMFEVKCYNLRALLFSCQKTMEMFDKLEKYLDIQFFRFVLCANTAFALKLKNDSSLVWTDNIKSPNELGSYHFPLYKCCYDYIKTQTFDENQFVKDATAYIKQKKFEVKQKDLQEALDILFVFYEKTEKEVSYAVEKIYTYLKEEENYLPLEQYGRLANYLIAVKKYIDDEQVINKCKEEILKKLNNSVVTEDTIQDLIYHSGIELWTDKQKEEYTVFSQEMSKSVRAESVVALEKISTPEDVKKLSKTIYENIDRYVGRRKFAGQLDIKGILSVLPSCSAAVISGLRGAFLEIYRSVNIKNFLGGDNVALTSLAVGINELINSGKISDKIQKLQLEWLVDNLKDIIDRLN